MVTTSEDQLRSFTKARELFLHGLAVIYLLAFATLLPQIQGLLSPEGIFPVSDFLSAVAKQHSIYQRLWLIPSVFWLASSSTALYGVLLLGCVSSLLSHVRALRIWSLSLCWLLYLSLVAAGGPFFQFQWDLLLLESGFIGILFASRSAKLQAGALFLLHWLLFRLLFSSGAVKLLSGDPHWRSLEALYYHFETQPLPTPLAYYLHRAPHWFLKTLCALTLIIEIICPFFIFARPTARRTVAVLFICFQLAIAATGNYAFFNLLTIVLCCTLLDDKLLSRTTPIAHSALQPRLKSISAVLLFAISLIPFSNTLLPQLPWGIDRLHSWSANFRISNSYGLFAVMTTKRLLVVLEGSVDGGQQWDEYHYAWHPQETSQAPRFIAPHHPRLDWQIWFAQFVPPKNLGWFIPLAGGLLADSKAITSLFHTEKSPSPPKQLRALMYHYQFTSRHEKKILNRWWERRVTGIYLHPVRKEPSREKEQ